MATWGKLAAAPILLVVLVAACGGEAAAPLGVYTDAPSYTEAPSPPPDSTPRPLATVPVPIALKFAAWSKSVRQGKGASATVRTVKKAECMIIVTYLSGISKAKGLGPKTADSNGAVTWKWEVGANTTPGSWPIEVTCRLGDRSATASVEFRVRD